MRYSIAEAAARSGFSIGTLRHYEKIKLIEAPGRDAAFVTSHRAVTSASAAEVATWCRRCHARG